MKEDSFKRVFDNFIDNNSDLISKYENECNDTFDENYDDLFKLCSKLNTSKLNVTIKSVIRTALINAISYQRNVSDCLGDLVEVVTDTGLSNDSINIYFREVNDIYNQNNNDYDIVYCDENREKLILMNLKTVISVAKKYQGLGLDLDDLIQAGNEGLCVSFEKYDPNRAKLKDKMLERAEELDDVVKIDDLNIAMSDFLTYGDVMKKFKRDFIEPTYSKQQIIKWIKKNIYNAKFNSVATMWIRAYILLELNNNSRIVKKPKSEIDKDVLETGAYKKEIKIDIDSPVGNDETRTIGDLLCIEDDKKTDLEIGEAQDLFKVGLNKLLAGVKPRDRSVFLKKFGIGLPRPMLPREIAEQEGLSIARVSQIFQTVEQQIQKNQVKYNINIGELMQAAKTLR